MKKYRLQLSYPYRVLPLTYQGYFFMIPYLLTSSNLGFPMMSVLWLSLLPTVHFSWNGMEWKCVSRRDTTVGREAKVTSCTTGNTTYITEHIISFHYHFIPFSLSMLCVTYRVVHDHSIASTPQKIAYHCLCE